MANYLVVAAKAHVVSSLSDWFNEGSFFRFRVDRNIDVVYISKGALSDIIPGCGIFKGYAIDHENSEIIFSGAGESPSIFHPKEGCYLRGQLVGGNFFLGSDLFSQLAVNYFCESGVAAFSDSLFLLAELRRKLGLKNILDQDVALSRAWLNGIASQQVSENSMIQNVLYKPIGSKLRVFGNEGGARLKVEREMLPEIFLKDIDDYRSTLAEGAERISSLIATYGELANAGCNVNISGGLDSRVCFAAALRSNGYNDFTFTSNKKSLDDYEVAEEICKKHSVHIGHSRKMDRIVQERLPTWFAFSAGLYDPLHAPGFRLRNVNFEIGGHGAEAIKGNYGWRSISSIEPKGFNNEVKEAFQNQAKQGLLPLGVSPESNFASEWHYLAYRNSIHSGRSTMTSLVSSRPILQSNLVGLSFSGVNEYSTPKKNDPSIISDLLIYLNEDLAKARFDKQEKNLSEGYVRDRRKYLGAATGEAYPYKIVGSPDTVSSGPLELVLKLALQHGFKSGLFSDKIKKLSRNGYDKIPSPIRNHFDHHLELVENHLADPVSSSSKESLAAGKLMAFLILD